MTASIEPPRPNKTDAGSGSEAVCRVFKVHPSPSPDPSRSESKKARETLAAFSSAFIIFAMPTLALQAHYDGQRIVLDEPCALPANASLMVTVLPAATESSLDDEAAWPGAMRTNEVFSFLAEPEEDIYTLEDGQPLSDAL